MNHKTLPAILLAALLATACGMRNENTATCRDFTDDYNRTVAVPTNPRRVVSLSPSVTEIMYALGADSLLVGRTDFCMYPPQASSIASVGGISNLNIEQVLGRNPDLVISGSMVSRKATDQMDRMGTPMVCVIEKPHFDALYANINAIGSLVGRQRQADSLNNLLRARVADLLENQPIIVDTPSVYYVVGFGSGGNFTAGGNTFINDIIRMAGGRNIAEKVEGWSYSLEALVHTDPDYIIVRREDSAAFCSTNPYNRLSAVLDNRVIGIESGTLDLQVPRNIDAIIYLRGRMQHSQEKE